MNFSEAAAEVIRLAEVRRNFWNTELPKLYPDYPIMRRGDPRPPSPPEDAELRQLLARLDPEVVYKLLVTKDLGRDYFATQAPERLYADLKATFPEVRDAVIQLAGSVALDIYLRDGLERLNRAGIDLDHVSLEPAGIPQ